MQVDIREFGGAPDSDATASLQRAIDAAAEAGGGRVTVSAGRWRTTAVHLKSGVELHLAHGARLHAMDDPAGYPQLPTGQPAAVINAVEAHDCAITGTGVIDGDGDSKRWGDEVDPDEFRFSLVRMVGCRDVRIMDVGLHWTRWWSAHLLRCEDVRITGCNVIARRDRINADGIDPDDCRRVRISDCRISTGDDAIVIKSTSQGVCEDILVSHCQLDSSCAAIKVGTESTGEIRNVVFANCIIRDSNVGLAAYLKDGGVYRDIRMAGCMVEACNAFPVLIDHTPRFHGQTPAGVLEGVSITDCTIRSAGRLFIGGTGGGWVKRVRVRDVDWHCTGACPYGPGIDRPLGAARVKPDPERSPVGTTPHHVVCECVEDADIAVRLHAAGDGDATRGLARLHRCRGVRLAGRPLGLPGAVEAVMMSECEGVDVRSEG